MPRHEFGIIDFIKKRKDYSSKYVPAKYGCISVDDSLIRPIEEKLSIIPAYTHRIGQPDHGLDYFGVTLIPPASFGLLLEILVEEKRKIQSSEYDALIQLVILANKEGKYIIHYGI